MDDVLFDLFAESEITHEKINTHLYMSVQSSDCLMTKGDVNDRKIMPCSKMN